MLKKVGIVAAAATAGVLALSPLAFASDKADSHRDDDRGGNTSLWYQDRHSGDSYQSTRCTYEDERSYGFDGTVSIMGDLLPGLAGVVAGDDGEDNNAHLNCSNFGDGSDWYYNERPEFGDGGEADGEQAPA